MAPASRLSAINSAPPHTRLRGANHRPSVACTQRQPTAGEKRDIVTGTYLTAAAALVIAGIVTGVLIVICLGIHREEHRGSLTKESDSRMDRGVRRLNGAGSRGYWLRVVSNDDDSTRRLRRRLLRPGRVMTGQHGPGPARPIRPGHERPSQAMRPLSAPADVLAQPMLLPYPPELPDGLPARPRVLQLTNADDVSRGLADGTRRDRASDQESAGVPGTRAGLHQGHRPAGQDRVRGVERHRDPSPGRHDRLGREHLAGPPRPRRCRPGAARRARSPDRHSPNACTSRDAGTRPARPIW